MAEWDILASYVTKLGQEMRNQCMCQVTAGSDGTLIMMIESIESLEKILKKFKGGDEVIIKAWSWYFYYKIKKKERFGYHPKCPYKHEQCKEVRLFYFTITAMLDRVMRFSEELSDFEDVSKDFQKGGNLAEHTRGITAIKQQLKEENRKEKIKAEGGVDIYS